MSVIDQRKNQVGKRVRRLRHERGLTQRNLHQPGITYAYVSRIEAGTRDPSLKALIKLGQQLGVTALYLLTGSDHAHCPVCGRKP